MTEDELHEHLRKGAYPLPGLGKFHDNAASLAAAANYLTRFAT